VSTDVRAPEAPAPAAPPQRTRRLDRRMDLRHFPGFGAIARVAFAFLYIPMAVVVVYAFNTNRNATIWRGFTTDWFAAVVGNRDIRSAAYNSLVVAITATTAATALALAAAVGLAALTSDRRRRAGLAVIAAPLFIPEIVTAVASVSFFVLIGLPLGLTSIIIAHTVFCIPFAYLPIRARLADLDPAYLQAAADLGATDAVAFRRILLPLLGPGILSGALLAFIISLDDFVISFFVAGAGATTLPIYIFGMIRLGITPAVNALSTIMLVISVAFVAASYLIGRRRRDRA
jgi:spermidine/putrescine transport system permease protein